jgi:hypothetical protein
MEPAEKPARSRASWASKRFATLRETPRPVGGAGAGGETIVGEGGDDVVVVSGADRSVVVALEARESAGVGMEVSTLGAPAAPCPDMRLVSIPGTRGADITVSVAA